MNERHVQSAMFLHGKALRELREMPLSKSGPAVKALDVGLRYERLIRGEPSERTAVSIEDTIKREYERWMVVDGGRWCRRGRGPGHRQRGVGMRSPGPDPEA